MVNLLVHYHELALKGRNRRFFEKKLIQEIEAFLKSLGAVEIERMTGRLLVQVDSQDEIACQSVLRCTPGLANVRVVETLPADLGLLTQKIPKRVLSDSRSFAVRARRDHKNYPFTSMQLCQEVGQAIVEATNRKVDLKNPDDEVYIEIVKGQAYVSTSPLVRGYQGLPVGVAGRGVVMLSGGFDSPVAAHLMQCRGLEIFAVHFHSAPLVSRASLDKVKELCEILGRSQSKLQLALVPIVEFQKKVVESCPESLRVLLYRRFMLRLAEVQATRWQAKVLITGDVLGQVSSQTLENITAMDQTIQLSILRPLLGMNKEWIISKAKEIQTHEVSILPHDDCCGYLMPRNPSLYTQPEELEEIEKQINIAEYLEMALNAKQEIKYECGQPV